MAFIQYEAWSSRAQLTTVWLIYYVSADVFWDELSQQMKCVTADTYVLWDSLSEKMPRGTADTWTVSLQYAAKDVASVLYFEQMKRGTTDIWMASLQYVSSYVIWDKIYE